MDSDLLTINVQKIEYAMSAVLTSFISGDRSVDTSEFPLPLEMCQQLTETSLEPPTDSGVGEEFLANTPVYLSFVCSVCKINFPSRTKLLHHSSFCLAQEATTAAIGDDGAPAEVSSLVCSKCSQSFSSRNKLFKHIKTCTVTVTETETVEEDKSEELWIPAGIPRGPILHHVADVLGRWGCVRKCPVRLRPMHLEGVVEQTNGMCFMQENNDTILRAIDALLGVTPCFTGGTESGLEGAALAEATSNALLPPPAPASSLAPPHLAATDAAASPSSDQPLHDETQVSPEVFRAVTDLLCSLGGGTGLCTLLGGRQTTGSVWPPRLPCGSDILLASFSKRHHPRELLSVGARALSKHAHRSLDGWWGTCTGKQVEKNAWAEQCVRRILTGAVWVNFHQLPHEEAVLEVRLAEGYGARWSADGGSFRGFLEPHVIGGHENKWRH